MNKNGFDMEEGSLRIKRSPMRVQSEISIPDWKANNTRNTNNSNSKYPNSPSKADYERAEAKARAIEKSTTPKTNRKFSEISENDDISTLKAAAKVEYEQRQIYERAEAKARIIEEENVSNIPTPVASNATTVTVLSNAIPEQIRPPGLENDKAAARIEKIEKIKNNYNPEKEKVERKIYDIEPLHVEKPEDLLNKVKQNTMRRQQANNHNNNKKETLEDLKIIPAVGAHLAIKINHPLKGNVTDHPMIHGKRMMYRCFFLLTFALTFVYQITALPETFLKNSPVWWFIMWLVTFYMSLAFLLFLSNFWYRATLKW